MRRRFLALGAVAAILITGCSSGRHHATGPTTSTAVAASPNPDVIPAVITPAYVDAVFRVLNHINGNAVRTLVKQKSLTPVVKADLKAVYGGALYPVELEVFQAGLVQNASNLRIPPGDRVTSVVSLITATPSCIFVQTVSSLAAVEIRPTKAAASEYWELQPKSPTDDPEHLNPTPWILTYNRDFQTPTTMQGLC